MSKALPCPCCEERSRKAGAFQFLPAGFAAPGACEACVLPPPPPRSRDVPPLTWPRTVGEIEALVDAVEAEVADERVGVVRGEGAAVRMRRPQLAAEAASIGDPPEGAHLGDLVDYTRSVAVV